MNRVLPLALSLLSAALPAAPADTPNLILLYADDLGFGDVSAYGATRVPTLHIDRFACEGMDVGETKNVAAPHPEVVQHLSALIEDVRKWRRTRP